MNNIQNNFIERKPENALQLINEYFYGNKEYIELFLSIQNEMLECDPDLLLCKRNSLIGFAKEGEKYRLYIVPTEDGFELQFAHLERRIPLDNEHLKACLKECEESVLCFLKQDMIDNDALDIDYTDVLNRSQRKFCKMASSKNIRLLAPAGSGKTYSILWRCRYITDDYEKRGKVPPYFLLVTFTKAACAELESRLKNDESFKGIRATVRTLNSWGWEQNKIKGKELAVSKFDRRNLITHDLVSIISNFPGLADILKGVKGKSINADFLIDLIDLHKSLGFEHQMLKSDYKKHVRYLKEIGLYHILQDNYKILYQMSGVDDNDKKETESCVTEFFKFWKKAVVRLEENHRFTLEDQKYWTNQYLKEKIAAKKYPQGVTRYTHLIVDEFQDINPLDLQLIKTISTYHGNGKNISMMIVGDDDQAIFGWRGTTPKYIISPDKYLDSKFETCILDTNYRSPKAIVNCSKSLIEHNKEREPKDMKSVAKGRAVVKVITRKKRNSLTDATMSLIHDLMENKGCKQIALIGRKQAAIFPYQVLLSAEGLSYNVESDIDIFEGEAMKSLQEIIKIIYRAKDYDNDDPCSELLTVCDKVNKYGMKKAEKLKLAHYIEQRGADTFESALSGLRQYPDKIKNDSAENLYIAVNKLYKAESVYEFMVCVEQELQGLQKDYAKKDTDNHYKEPQFFRLTELSKKYGNDYRSFYRDIEKARKNGEFSRSINSVGYGNEYQEHDEVPIHLLTATRSKGHEFDAVIILEAYDNEWPAWLSDDIEEERRLFYVAMTRAKKYLYFMTSEDEAQSRFLQETGI